MDLLGSVFLILIAAVILIIAVSSSSNSRRKVKEEPKRLTDIDDRMRISLQNEEAKRQELKRTLEQARMQLRADFRQFAEASGVTWSVAKLDVDRLNRAYNQKDQFLLEAYDPRCRIAKVRGTTFNHYLTSASFCTCEDFHRRHLPCKHMFYLAQQIAQRGEIFIEQDYENGLSDTTAYIFGRFPDGKDTAIQRLKERGLSVRQEMYGSTRIAVAGKSNAVKTVESLRDEAIPILSYPDALQIFTSEIRYPEIIDDTSLRQTFTVRWLDNPQE